MTEKKIIFGVLGDPTGEIARSLQALTPKGVKVISQERIVRSEESLIKVKRETAAESKAEESVTPPPREVPAEKKVSENVKRR